MENNTAIDHQNAIVLWTIALPAEPPLPHTRHSHSHTKISKEKIKFPQIFFPDSDAYLINVYSSSHCTDSQGNKWYSTRKKEQLRKEKKSLHQALPHPLIMLLIFPDTVSNISSSFLCYGILAESSHSWINWINAEVFICYVSLTN